MTQQLLVFGPGYSARPIIKQAQKSGWAVFATYRQDEKKEQLIKSNIQPVSFDAAEISDINTACPMHILVSIAPKTDKDPTLRIWESWLRGQSNITSIHYLSSTNVYGDHQGAWVDETTPPVPGLERGKHRHIAEQDWQNLATSKGTQAFMYRLAGIYGPNRNAFNALKAGRARCLIKENQVFSRIHVDDICQTVWAAMNSNHNGGIFNLADDSPTPPHEVIEAAAAMIGLEPPQREPWDKAELSEMARSFYLESKRVKNTKIKQELGIRLLYPDYQAGLKALLETEYL